MKTWAISGVDLHLDLSGTRVRTALESALREAVRTGRLPEGTRLPSSRALAGDLGIARNTVADAYGQLVAEGWLSARTGSGTSVAGGRSVSREAAAARRPAGRTVARYDLRPGSPTLSLFPRSTWLAAGRRALGAAPADALGYGDTRGLPVLREALAGYLARARGVRADPECVVVCGGFTQALALLARIVRDRGATTLGIEAYGHRHHREVITAAGLRPDLVEVDEDGAVIPSRGGALLLTPAHQFPLGMPLAAHRRTEAVRWAQATGGFVIEDDYDGEFRYDRQPVGALQALSPEHVVYAGTASKTLAPGLRLAWLVVPAALLDEVIEAKQSSHGQTSTFDQLTLAEFVRSGAYDRHIRRCRLAYRRRRDRLVTVLRREAPEVRITGAAAGMHALLELPASEDEDEIIARADRHGLALEGLREYCANPGYDRPALVAGYATPPDHAYTGALARLCAVLPH